MTMPLLDLRALPEPGARRDASMTWIRFMGIDPQDPTTFGNLRDYGIGVQDEAWTYTVIYKTAVACQGVPLRVYQKNAAELVPLESMDPGPLRTTAQRIAHVLEWVNPIDMTGSALKQYTSAAWNLWGGYYLLKVRGRYGGPPQELYWLSPPDVQPVSSDGRNVDYYQYNPRKGTPRQLAPDDVIVHRRFNPADPLMLLSPLSAVRNEIQVQIQASIHTNSLLKNHSMPAMAVIAKEGGRLSRTDRGTLARMFRALRGPSNAGKTPIIDEPVDIKDLSVHSQDAEYIAAREIARKSICAVLGMPPVVAGDDERTAVYGNYRDARKMWWQDTLIPYLDGQADSYNNWLVPEFEPTGQLVVAYDYGQIEALQEPWAQQVTAWMMLQDRGDVVGNEVRAHFRLGRAVPWGDQPMPPTKIALKGDAATGTALGTSLFGTTPVPTAFDLVEQPGGLISVGPPDLGAAERAAARLAAYGRDLYKHPAVRSYLGNGTHPLDVGWLIGEPASDAVRLAIEAGLRRRDSADQLAAALEGEPS